MLLADAADVDAACAAVRRNEICALACDGPADEVSVVEVSVGRPGGTSFDCRCAAAALWRLHGVVLAGVRDLQLAEAASRDEELHLHLLRGVVRPADVDSAPHLYSNVRRLLALDEISRTLGVDAGDAAVHPRKWLVRPLPPNDLHCGAAAQLLALAAALAKDRALGYDEVEGFVDDKALRVASEKYAALGRANVERGLKAVGPDDLHTKLLPRSAAPNKGPREGSGASSKECILDCSVTLAARLGILNSPAVDFDSVPPFSTAANATPTQCETCLRTLPAAVLHTVGTHGLEHRCAHGEGHGEGHVEDHDHAAPGAHTTQRLCDVCRAIRIHRAPDM
ncbi:hypothetical protein M885DRAFT_600090 [Pelagophyceae sp. CCMP2097]|nr:hypothetical protein M885DRAFT_600090 [Pelagophyceae sp. CCMP2097]